MLRLAILLGGMVLSLLPGQAAAQAVDTVTIGFLADGPYQRHAHLAQLLRDEIRDLLSDEFDVRTPAAAYIEADFTIGGIEAGLDRLLGDPDVDVIVAFGAISSHVAAHRQQLQKPVVAMVILSPEVRNYRASRWPKAAAVGRRTSAISLWPRTTKSEFLARSYRSPG